MPPISFYRHQSSSGVSGQTINRWSGMLSLTLVLGPWLSLKTKLQFFVLFLALRVESLVLALNFKSLVESFCHNRLVVQWYGPGLRDLEIQTICNISTLQLSTNPSRHYRWMLCEKFASIQPLLFYVLCSPAMSAPVERVFSQSGLLMRPNRARMSNSLLETLVFLKCNSSVCV